VHHKKRQEFLCDMVEGVIKRRSVIFSEIADKIDKPIQPSSIERRIQDFFAKVNLDYQQLAGFLMRQFYKQQISEPVRLALETACLRFNLFYKTVG